MGKMRHRGKVDPSERIINIVMVSGISSSLFNSTVLIISTAAGEWLLGDAMCQIYALFSHILIVGATWMLSLAACERCYKLLTPSDHPSMFSQINLKIIFIGLYMLIFLMCIGPIYGWGEYSNYRGKLDMVVMISPIAVNVSTGYSSSAPFPEYTSTQIFYNESEEFKCPPFAEIAKVLLTYLETKTDISIRKFVDNPEAGTISLSLRMPSDKAVEEFYGLYINNIMSKEMTDILLDTFSYVFCKNKTSFLKALTTIDEDEYIQYKEVYVTFQSLGICAIDFTDVNKNLTSWLVFMFITMLAIPYGSLFLSTSIILFLRDCIGTDIMTSDDVKHAKILAIGGFVSLSCCAPYYVLNLANAKGQFVHIIANFTATFLFYNSTSIVPILYIVTNFPSSRRSRSSSKTEVTLSPSIEVNGDVLDHSISGNATVVS